MSTNVNLTSERGFHFENKNANRCLNGSALNCSEEVAKENPERTRDQTVKKCCSSFLEFCTTVANELPQRQAFHAVDLADVLWKIQEWKERLPNVEIFYAVKANTDPVLLKLLSLLELSFDCASQEEIQMALDAGASPNNIIFAHTIKPLEELQFASKEGVDLMTFDNEDELLKIREVHPEAKLLLRLIPCNVSCSFDLSDKFGCSEEEAERLLKIAKQLNLTVMGISFHVGALCDDPESYRSTIRACRRLFDKARELGFSFTILDIGGGFFGESNSQGIFYKMADNINKALKECFDDGSVRIIAEPGTYVVGSAFKLICTVLGRRCFEKAEKEGIPKRQYYLNDGIYGSFFRGIDLYGIRLVPLLPESEIQTRAQYESRVYGQTCCSEDVIRRTVVLPDLKVGERVCWENMGAYSLGICSTFCGTYIPLAKYLFTDDRRLNMDWMKNKEVIETYLKKQVTFIEKNAEQI